MQVSTRYLNVCKAKLMFIRAEAWIHGQLLSLLKLTETSGLCSLSFLKILKLYPYSYLQVRNRKPIRLNS